MRSLLELHGDALRLETDAEGSWVIAPDGNRWLVRVVDWDALTEKAANVAANSPKIAGEFEFESLGAILGELEAAEFPAFEELRFDDLLTDISNESPKAKTGETDPDDVPDEPKEPVTKRGDLWELGNHRLLCGDSTSAVDVGRVMGGEKADMLNTDPPYGVDYEGIENDRLKADKLREFLFSSFTLAFQYMRPGSNAYVWHADITSYEFIGAFRDSGFTQARPSIIQWVKDSLVLSQGDYHSRNEPCLFGWKAGSGRVRVSDRTQDTLWEFPKPKKADGHPTIKPIGLFSRALVNSSVEGHVVFDPFLGSGTTMIAAETLSRRCFGLEISPKYCDVIVQRWVNFTGVRDIKRNGEPFRWDA